MLEHRNLPSLRELVEWISRVPTPEFNTDDLWQFVVKRVITTTTALRFHATQSFRDKVFSPNLFAVTKRGYGACLIHFSHV